MVAIPAAVMIGLTAASTAVGAASAISSGNAQAAQQRQNAANANYQAALTTRNAGAEAQQQQEQAEQNEQQNNQRLGAIRALYGASGVDPTGSVMDVLQGNANQMGYQQRIQNYDETLRQQGFASEASGDQAEAAADMQQANNARTAGYMGAGSAVLSGASSFGNSSTGQGLLSTLTKAGG